MRERGSDEEKLAQQQSLDVELRNSTVSVRTLNSDSDELERRKACVLGDLRKLRERIDGEGHDSEVRKLVLVLESLKALEARELALESDCNAKRSKLQTEVCELEEKVAAGVIEDLDRALVECLEKLKAAKKELAAKLRAVLSVKRQLNEVPTQAELIQYERRFSELNAHIQEKHQQTRKYYATYNALLEIKELMLKETSLLNSISTQFQDAITSIDGRMKLIHSMEGIVNGTQQKLQKVQVELLEEQKVCDTIKKRYAAAVAEQRRCYSLLKAFQEECAKNERLKNLGSM